MALITWRQTSITMQAGATATVSFDCGSEYEYLGTISTTDTGVATITTQPVSGNDFAGDAIITAVSEGTVTTTCHSSDTQSAPLTITVVAAEEKFLNKSGLDYYDSLIADEMDGKQDKLTAGTGIAISNNVISATGGGEADSVAWGHITGSMSNQTDLTTALNAKANTADLATVATSGSYNDLSNKPTIGNATITIQKNGSSAGTFTTNATSNKSINIAVPTKTSDLTNDSGFIDEVSTITNARIDEIMGVA